MYCRWIINSDVAITSPDEVRTEVRTCIHRPIFLAFPLGFPSIQRISCKHGCRFLCRPLLLFPVRFPMFKDTNIICWLCPSRLNTASVCSWQYDPIYTDTLPCQSILPVCRNSAAVLVSYFTLFPHIHLLFISRSISDYSVVLYQISLHNSLQYENAV